MERGADARNGTEGERAQDGVPAPLGLRHQGLREQVLDELRRRIVDGVYPPGSRLTEDRLAEDFGVSRNPVREALRVAVADGLVTLSPRRGATVSVPDPSSVADLFVVRVGLEPLAARLAAERVTPADVARLRALLDEAARATDAGDLARVAQLNTDLHLAVVRLSGNRWLTTVVTPLYLHVQWVFRLGAEVRAPHSWREHIRLVDAIAAGDADGAEEAARSHVEAAARAAVEPHQV